MADLFVGASLTGYLRDSINLKPEYVKLDFNQLKAAESYRVRCLLFAPFLSLNCIFGHEFQTRNVIANPVTALVSAITRPISSWVRDSLSAIFSIK